MMPSKRARACDACHSIKIKCTLGSAGGAPPCERCLRLEKNCVVSPPVRQKDRVAELEAKIEALTKLLDAQNLQVTATDSAAPELSREKIHVEGSQETPHLGSSKKRRCGSPPRQSVDETLRDKDHPAADPFTMIGLELDHVVPPDLQMIILEKYRHEIQPRLSLASLVTTGDYSDLRVRCPVLLQVVIYVACSRLVSADTQEEIARVIFDLLSPNVIAKTKKSMDLVQALQLAAFWYRIPRHHLHLPVFQLVQQAVNILEELGIAYGPEPSKSNEIVHSIKNFNAGDVWRTWNACFLYSACWGVLTRRSHPISWGQYQELSAFSLEYYVDGLDTDRILCQFVRAMRVCEQIVLRMRLMDPNFVVDVADTMTQVDMHGLRNLITDWTAQIPVTISCPCMKMWEPLAILYLHECILHTATNVESFGGPYIAERLSVSDFPTPIVTPDHVVSLHIIRDASHALLGFFTSLDITSVLGYPPGLFLSHALYAQWILIKLFVSATALGNTYGAFIDPQSLKVEHYLTQTINLGDVLTEYDPRCVQARILNATNRVKEWLHTYNQKHVIEMPGPTSNPLREASTSPEGLHFGDISAIDWRTFSSNDTFEYGLENFLDYPI